LLNNNSTINACSGLYYDSGSSTGLYLNNENYTQTVCSDSGDCVQFFFYSVDIASDDTLRIYDGASTASPLIGKYTNKVKPPTLLSSTGCLTFNFVSNGVSVDTGFSAIIKCYKCPSVPGTTANYKQKTIGIDGSTIGAAMVATCSGTFTDNSGVGMSIAGIYANNIGSSTYPIYESFCPNVINNCIRASFWKAQIKSGDKLNIRNGPASSNAKLGTITNTSCSTYAACLAKGWGPYTSSDPSGCLTFDFYSNAVTQDSGWVATFDCIPCATGPNGLDNSDCVNVTSLCTNTTFSDASTGPGVVSEIPDNCLITETYSNWYTFEVVTGGTLGMTIDPLSTTGTPDDYDWAMYGPNITCGNLGSPIRCSSATTQGQNSNTGNMGNTGISSVNNDAYANYCGGPYNDNTETACGNCWVEDLPVLAGETYYLCVSKWSSGGSGFNLNWTLTNGATIDCPVLPIELTNFECNATGNAISLTWTTASEFNNDYFVAEHSVDGENYQTLTTVPGKSYSITPTQYFAIDYHPSVGLKNYRLKQMDTNGHEEILKSTSCFSAVTNEAVHFEVFDLTGKLMYSKDVMYGDVANQLQNLPLPSGVYLYAIIYQNGKADLSKYLKVK
jgi:hypothetical protein